MSLFKKIEKPVDSGVALERPEVVVISDGDASELENVLAQFAARFGGQDKVNAVVTILAVYEDMPRENKMRTRKGQGEYLSAIHYANKRPIVLPFGLSENNLRVSLALSEKIAQDDDDEGGNEDTAAE